ncbi:triphosphoribosyl-dephospho-CoA synthase CitG [Vibrio anguillarum]|uniref:triphosphoribosyl-dephospho-CoA synthase CitG n=1 Tax=Vibrio anguillarum TaxID=55601 RepID=UPI003CE6E800
MIANRSIEWLMDDCCLYQPAERGALRLNICVLAGNLAYHAMMLEVHLTPKAGLVDCSSNGAHHDMDIHTFVRSCDALRPFMKAFVKAGARMSYLPAKSLLPGLRTVGIQAEKAMFSATNKVNTHKGMIFTLGLICGAVGWLYQKGLSYDSQRVRAVIKECCASLVVDDLKLSNKIPVTAGEKLYKQFGITGIRGEASKGYPTIYCYGLPIYQECILQGHSEEQALSKTLLSLMSHNCDSNVVNRGGMSGLDYVQSQSRQLLEKSHYPHTNLDSEITLLDQQFTHKNLSPGGSADLLALLGCLLNSIFVHRYW